MYIQDDTINGHIVYQYSCDKISMLIEAAIADMLQNTLTEGIQSCHLALVQFTAATSSMM